jgi:hypothetical protein
MRVAGINYLQHDFRPNCRSYVIQLSFMFVFRVLTRTCDNKSGATLYLS